MNVLIQKVTGVAYKVHNQLGAGFLEKIYEKAMIIELQKLDIEAKSQFPIPVYYDDIQIGDYYADMFIDDCLIVELKAIENLTIAHEKQLVNYLAATKIDDGLLINFNSSVQIKRKFRIYKQKENNL
ncbi:MAG: GxxExxY protein [Prevotellaceae bacterium]|jgi:GxxExxY protein|nr:GxxExxY protein [Prevotellaceae bacterium]